jgi:hypothetical protein
MHRTADGVFAEKRFLEGKDRGVRDRMESPQVEIALMEDTWFSNGCASFFASSSQNFSRGEAPMTTAIVCVSGRTRRMLPKNAEKSLWTEMTVSLLVRSVRSTSRCSTAVSTMGVSGKSCARYFWTNLAAGAPTLNTISG